MDPLVAPFRLEYPYRRSLGPVIGRFYTELREGRIVGIRTAAGRVLVPPLEYDPATGEPTGDFAPVADEGVVETWCGISGPGPAFCWALIRLDGADTALLHVVDGPVATGSRVRARWRDERVGAMSDIVAFVPCR